MAITDGLVSYYKLDEESGTVLDSHGSNDATNVNGTPGASGVINTAYSFNSALERIYLGQIGTQIVTAESPEWSYATWIKKTGTYGQFFTGQAVSSNPGSTTWFNGTINSDNIITFSPTFSIATSDEPISDNEWYHVVVVDNGTIVTLYVNGIPQTNTALTNTPTSHNHWAIGSIRIQDDTFGGVVDEVGIWNRNLTPAEVLKLYKLQLSGISYPFLSYAKTVSLTIGGS